jgi:UDP-N-acetylmuramoyl-tripeptide--D-alanyl-D-alanine ligase
MMPLGVVEQRQQPATPAWLAEICNGKVLRRGCRGGFRPGRFVIDSREVRKGDCFVALPGARLDGHDFLAEALGLGAAGVLVCQPISRTQLDSGAFVVRVDSSHAALLDLAAEHRRQHSAKVIGITGSCGKTSTKDMLGQVLSRYMPAVWSPRSFNNHVGVPLSLFQLRTETKACVVEIGTNAPGEIAELVAVAQPDIGIITRVDESHLMRLGSLEGVAQEKSNLISGLASDGLAILNGDDPTTALIRDLTSARLHEVRTNAEADWFATDIDDDGLGTSFRLQGETPVTLPCLGLHNVYNALFTVAAAVEVGVPLDEIVAGLAEVPPTSRRLEYKQLGDVSVIDDTYNANPASARAALLTLSGLPASGRRLAAFGEMLELGPRSEELHRALGVDVAESGADVLISVGEGARPIAEAAVEHGMDGSAVHVLENSADAVAFLHTELRSGDWLLCKASRGVGLDSVVDGLEILLSE